MNPPAGTPAVWSADLVPTEVLNFVQGLATKLRDDQNWPLLEVLFPLTNLDFPAVNL